jgi:predicted DNA-binding WGR domain protein
MARYLEYHNDAENSHKFYLINVTDGIGSYESGIKTTYGRIGSNGHVRTKYFETEGEAIAYKNKKISQKIQKGYKECFERFAPN